MDIELFINFDSEPLIFCEQSRGKIKNTQFSQNPLKLCFPKSCVSIILPHGWGKMIQYAIGTIHIFCPGRESPVNIHSSLNFVVSD